MATEAIHKYLAETNRPYSANDITLNLHKEYGKTAVQKALDELSADGRVREKTYGKQKVYCVVQEQGDNSDDELRALDEQIATKAEAISAVESELRQSESLLRELTSTPTTEEASVENLKLTSENEALRARLARLEETSRVVSKDERDITTKKHATAVREYRKRKRMCTEILDSILEGYPKGKKHLYEEVGVETDQDADMPQLSV